MATKKQFFAHLLHPPRDFTGAAGPQVNQLLPPGTGSIPNLAPPLPHEVLVVQPGYLTGSRVPAYFTPC